LAIKISHFIPAPTIASTSLSLAQVKPFAPSFSCILAISVHLCDLKWGRSSAELALIASIIASETNRKEEYPTIASIYLNRLRKGIALQACPTVIFAVGDFKMRRVLKRHLAIDSPYNTYKYRGLPPGPIRLARPDVIDAVLNAPKTDYLYMCANPDFSGTHIFSSSYGQHSAVARQYQRALNQRRVR
jgi:UPF0755 protein